MVTSRAACFPRLFLTWLLWVFVPLHAQTTSPQLDVLIFKDGDQMSGELLRAERGTVVFRSYKTGEATIDFSFIADLRCQRRFAVLRKGMRVTKQNAVIGHMELRGDDVVITPDSGPPLILKSEDVAYAVDDAVFEREVSRRTNLHEGWTGSISLGASIVRSTETGTAFNTDLSLTRVVPGVDYLPRRHRTQLNLRDGYEVISRPDPGGAVPFVSETHILHADAEQDEYIHPHLYLLANYSFDRNFAQGLSAQELAGAGIGWTVVQNFQQELDIKSDFHRETQGFSDRAENDTLFGQKFVVEYQRNLARGITYRQTSNYLAAYNLLHRYSANTNSVLTIPLYRRLGVSFTVEDNYLNNPVPGLKRNTLRFITGITFAR